MKMLRTGQKAGQASAFSRRRFLATGTAAFAAPLVSLYRPANAQSVQPVTILTWETYHDDAWLAELTESTGIPVNVIRAGSVDEMFAQTRSGAISPDVLYVDTSSTGRYIAADLLVPFEADRLANAGNIDASLDWKTFNTIGDKLWGAPYAWGSLPLMYDADAVSPAPTSWLAMWDPANAGRVSTFDDAFLNIPMVALAIRAANPFNTSPEEDAKIIDSLRALRPQIRTIARGFDDMAGLFQSGDAKLAFCQNIAIPKGLRANGKNIGISYPEEKTLAWVDNAVVTKTGAGRQEVYDFINACLDVKWQARFTEVSGNNCVISPAVALQNGLSQKVHDDGEMKFMNDPSFWSKMAILEEQKALDQRLETWNEFKSGLL
jgi:spermidine/putrescine transport system substrate-binding protein